MVRDPASGNGFRTGHEGDEAHAPQSDQAGYAPPSNLTKELAQLLAASIAQNQGSRTAGTTTNADLTSLANLVSAAERQRTMAPTFKDGLSALTYAPAPSRPHHTFEPDHHDDEPMPIPSTWREPPPQDDQKWYRQQMGAAILGLVAGLMIVVPTVLWLSGWLNPQKFKLIASSSTDTVAASDATASEVKTVKVQIRQFDRPAERAERPIESAGAAQYVVGSVDVRAPAAEALQVPQPQPVAAAARVIEPPRSRTDDTIEQATRRISSGDVTGARDLLATVEDGRQGPVSFALAETYDPNMLAAWGSRGIAADVARARALYRKALDLGVARAQGRLDALR